MLSLWSDLSILNLGLLAFSMYAVMFPAVFAAAHWSRIDGRAVVASIVAGEAVVMLAVFSPESFEGWWVQPVNAAMPTAVVPSLVAAISGLAIGQYAFSRRPWFVGWVGFDLQKALPLLGLIGVFILAQDFWWWEESEVSALGLPIWIWWAAALSVAQTAIMANWTGKEGPR